MLEQAGDAREGGAIEGNEDVAEEQAGLGGGAAGLHAEDEQARLLAGGARHRAGEADRLAGDAEVAALGTPRREDLADDAAERRRGDRDRRAADQSRGVHAEDAPREIQERTPGGAGKGAEIRLQVAVDP